MITSLNVNNFVGNNNWFSLQGNFSQQEKIWNQMNDYYFNFIREHIRFDDDIVFLHEVPYIKEKESLYSNEKIFYERSVIKENDITDEYLKKSFLSLKWFCEENGYELLMNEREETSFFVTLAIFKKGKYKRIKTTHKYKDYRNRILVVEKSQNPDDTFVAVHAPSRDKDIYDFWKTIICLFKELRKNNGRKVLIIGDMNVYMPGTKQKHMFNQLLSEGMFDLWIESGYSHHDATFETKNCTTRIDYCLVSDNGFEMYEIKKDDSTRLLHHSDHSCLMVFKTKK